MVTVAYTSALALFMLFSAVGWIVPATLTAAVFLGLLAHAIGRDINKLRHRPTLKQG